MTVPLTFWKPALNPIMDQLSMWGHRVGVFTPVPPQILPSGEVFFATSKCERCGAGFYARWDGEELHAGGEILLAHCSRPSLRATPA